MVALAGLWTSTAFAKTATFAIAPIAACPVCTAVDSMGLVVTATGHQLPNGWDVKTSVDGLYIANGIGGVFSGSRQDLRSQRPEALRHQQHVKHDDAVTYMLYAFHLGNPIADVVQVTINSRVVHDVPLTDPRLSEHRYAVHALPAGDWVQLLHRDELYGALGDAIAFGRRPARRDPPVWSRGATERKAFRSTAAYA
jgi:hypothetical protein